MFKKLLSTIAVQKQQGRETTLYRDLLRHEARIGGQLFGPVPKNYRREFFCLDEHTWVWHEERVDSNGQRHITTTRYDVRPSGVVKSQNGQHYQPISHQEAQRLWQAANAYRERVNKEVYTFV